MFGFCANPVAWAASANPITNNAKAAALALLRARPKARYLGIEADDAIEIAEKIDI